MDQVDLEIELDKDLGNELLMKAIEESIEKESDEKSLNSSKKKKRKKITSRKMREQLKIRTVVLVILALLVNTYAWFVYISTASLGMDVHIKSWKFNLLAEDMVDNVVSFTINEAYPGMETQKKTIEAENDGEMDAQVEVYINKIQIFDEIYIADQDNVIDGGTRFLTSNDLIELLKTRYPFKIAISIDGDEFNGNDPTNPIVLSNGEDISIEFSMSWAFETTIEPDGSDLEENDKEDTKYGELAYQYYVDNASLPDPKYCIKIDAVVKAAQIEEPPAPPSPPAGP